MHSSTAEGTLVRGSIVHALLRQAGDVDIQVVFDRDAR